MSRPTSPQTLGVSRLGDHSLRPDASATLAGSEVAIPPDNALSVSGLHGSSASQRTKPGAHGLNAVRSSQYGILMSDRRRVKLEAAFDDPASEVGEILRRQFGRQAPALSSSDNLADTSPRGSFGSNAPASPVSAIAAFEHTQATITQGAETEADGNKLVQASRSGIYFPESVTDEEVDVSSNDVNATTQDVRPSSTASGTTTTQPKEVTQLHRNLTVEAKNGIPARTATSAYPNIVEADRGKSIDCSCSVDDHEDCEGRLEADDKEVEENELAHREHDGCNHEHHGDEADEDVNHDQARKFTSKVVTTAHTCGDHDHPHSHANQQSIRMPDGHHELFSVAFKVQFIDTSIEYSRALASMANRVKNSTSLVDHDFEHLHRLIKFPLHALVAGINPLDWRLRHENRKLLHRYTLELDLFNGDHGQGAADRTTFLNLARQLVTGEEAIMIIMKVQEIISHAIEVVDRLVVERRASTEADAKHCPCSLILDSEVRRALEKAKLHERQIAMLQSDTHRMVLQMRAASERHTADEAAEAKPVASSPAGKGKVPNGVSSPVPASSSPQ